MLTNFKKQQETTGNNNNNNIVLGSIASFAKPNIFLVLFMYFFMYVNIALAYPIILGFRSMKGLWRPWRMTVTGWFKPQELDNFA